MKQCPQCNTTYTDDTLRFCLADGSRLHGASEEIPTVVKGRNTGHGAESQNLQTPAASDSSKGPWIKIFLGILLIGFLGIAVVGLAGVFIYYNTAGDGAGAVPKFPSPTPSPSATLDPERRRLQDELANLRKTIDEQKKAPVNTNQFPDDDDDEMGSTVTATVNSPKDGFLALRNAPDVKNGERLAKIPHDMDVEIQNCEKTQVTLDGRTGRWCQVMYNGQMGWVFDAWLDY